RRPFARRRRTERGYWATRAPHGCSIRLITISLDQCRGSAHKTILRDGHQTADRFLFAADHGQDPLSRCLRLISRAGVEPCGEPLRRPTLSALTTFGQLSSRPTATRTATRTFAGSERCSWWTD